MVWLVKVKYLPIMTIFCRKKFPEQNKSRIFVPDFKNYLQ